MAAAQCFQHHQPSSASRKHKTKSSSSSRPLRCWGQLRRMPIFLSRGAGNDQVNDYWTPYRPKLGRLSFIRPQSFLLCALLTLLFGISAIDSLLMSPLPSRLNLSLKSGLANRVSFGPALAEPQPNCAREDALTFDLQSWVASPNTLNASVDEHSNAEGSPQNSTVCHFYSENQLKSIQSDAPAILLKSGPGTGKTYALASRIVHLLQSGKCRPEQMAVLSFTNRDAHTLKEKAVAMLAREKSESVVSKKEVTDRLWSGTIHAFASSIIRTYSRGKFRVISSKEMRARADKCLSILLEEKNYTYRGEGGLSKLKSIRVLHRDAFSDVRQSRGMLIHQIGRCIELWKEAGMLPPPAMSSQLRKKHSPADSKIRHNCVELSMRLGISQNVALLTIELLPHYQTLHEAHGTADPSDLAAIASHILSSNINVLNAFREKLKHIILDEYQDVSVSQHYLIRLIVQGIVDETHESGSLCASMSSLPPVLDSPMPANESTNVCFQVPNLFCGGDSNQSIYGWRGAAPYLSIEGFRRDYPQGIVVPLDTSFRLARNVWNTANRLVDPEKEDKRKVKTFSTSPITRMRDLSDHWDETLQVLFSKASTEDELNSVIRVQGLWDAREEAKYIASTIRKRHRARMQRLTAALKELGLNSQGSLQTLRDPSDVAIMVRSGNEMELIKEYLTTTGIPFVVCESEADLASSTRRRVNSSLKLMDMNPVVLMTMHRAKGEEFDDVYLAGWTEGTFPHCTAVSTNRVDEERRLAFVAITRARQQVVVTHSFVSRVLHYGPDLMSKYVTTQVRPSRFLYELVPAATSSSANTVHNAKVTQKNSPNGLPTVVWNRGKGIKEIVAGRDVPEYFVNSYVVKSTFSPVHSLTESDTVTGKYEHNVTIRGSQSTTRVNVAPKNKWEPSTETMVAQLTASDKEVLNTVISGLHEMCEQKKRTNGKYKIVFRDLLRGRFNQKRGSALVLPPKEIDTKECIVSYYTLLNTPREQLGRRPLSQCTAIELGLYVAYNLLSPFTTST